jgi:serine/threonine-protein kinase
MVTTRYKADPRTQALGADGRHGDTSELTERYLALMDLQRTQWTTYHRFGRLLGSGGQGIVFLSERRGTDGFTVPVAMKVFSPETFHSQAAYERDMLRIGTAAAHVAQIQHDNVLHVHDFVDRNRIRIMIMEWIDGYDLRELMSLERWTLLGEKLPEERWHYINSVVMTAGKSQTRFKAGVAVAIVRDCLSALAALHRAGIVHGDIKPSNIMLKRTGLAKVIDVGSAFQIAAPPLTRMCSPQYAAPEVLENTVITARSDLASLGYCLVEMLAGRAIFDETASISRLLEQKRDLPRRLHSLLPHEVTCNDLLMNLCRGLIAPDPMIRFPTAEAADLLQDGAASFLRQLVLSNLSTEYNHDIHIFLEEMRMVDEFMETKTLKRPKFRNSKIIEPSSSD